MQRARAAPPGTRARRAQSRIELDAQAVPEPGPVPTSLAVYYDHGLAVFDQALTSLSVK